MHGILQPLQGEMEKGRRDLTQTDVDSKQEQIPLPTAPLCCAGFCFPLCSSFSRATSLGTAEPQCGPHIPPLLKETSAVLAFSS